MDRQVAMLGDNGYYESHHCAYRRGLPQVAVNHEPDVARKGWHVLMDADEIVVFVSEEAGQAGYTYPSPYGNQMFADVVQFAGHWPLSGNAEQPPLLRHVGEALIEGNKLPALGRRHVS